MSSAATIAEHAAPSVAAWGRPLPPVPDETPVVHFTEALAMLGAATDTDLSGGRDLAPAHERWPGECVRRERGSEFVFVEGYPMAKRPF